MKLELVMANELYIPQIKELQQEYLADPDSQHFVHFRIWTEDGIEEGIKRIKAISKGENLPEGWVPDTTFWLLDQQGRILGELSLRHRLSPALLIRGGHIGYYIRPSSRGRGYGREILRLGLIEARKLGIEKALLTCDDDNFRSARVIEANGGKLEKKAEIESGQTLRYYWCDTAS